LARRLAILSVSSVFSLPGLAKYTVCNSILWSSNFSFTLAIFGNLAVVGAKIMLPLTVIATKEQGKLGHGQAAQSTLSRDSDGFVHS
jgi:hypothetical protein